MTVHSELVVAVRVTSGSLKRAKVRVLEVFRGEATPGDELQIAFRNFNLDLDRDHRIVFIDGESDILFLVPELNRKGLPKEKNRFTLHRGRWGKFTLPREGEGLYLEAVHEFARLALLKDHRQLYAELRELPQSDNAVLVDIGLSEIGRLRLMDHELIPVILPYLQDPSPKRRSRSLQLLADWLNRVEDPSQYPELWDTVLPAIQRLARNDSQDQVRAAAVDALGAWRGEEVESTLREVAELDREQEVRYRAQLMLLERSQRLRSSGEEKQEDP
jgi:hypothetical protein